MKPAVPMAMAWRAESPSGRATAAPGRDPRVAGVPAVAGHAEVAAVGEDLGPDRQGGVVAGHHHAGQVDAGHEGRDAGHAVARARVTMPSL